MTGMAFRSVVAPGHPQRRRLSVSGPLLRAGVLAGVGGIVLVAAGVLGRMAFAPDVSVVTQTAAPQIWISALNLPDIPALTRADEVMPTPARRITASLPAGSVASPFTAPQPGPDAAARAPLILITPSEAPSAPRTALPDPSGDVVLARGAAATPAQAASAVRGVDARTDGVPVVVATPRPAIGTDAPARPPATVAALPVDTGLARSPLPPVRPAQVAQMAQAARTAPEVAPQLSSMPAQTLRPSARPAEVARLAGLASPVTALTQTGPQARLTPAALTVPPLLTDRSAAPSSGCGAALSRAIPRRTSGAQGGRAAMARLSGAGGTARDGAIVRILEGGNLPDRLRNLVPVTLTAPDGTGRRTQITICVMPDYLAVGSDRDFVRVPMGLPAATRLADRFDMMLPTARMVDAIHAQAQFRVAPSPMTPGAQMASTDYFVRHNATVEAQLARRGAGPGAGLGALVSGHKKDLVITNRLSRVAGRVAIYGWHRANGQPIQPLSTVHGQNYADYSHGVRLISRTAFLNGRAVDLRDLLADGRYAGLLTGEGPIATRILLAALH